MNAHRYPGSSSRSPRALERPLDEEEFLDACLALAKGPHWLRLNDPQGPPDEAPVVASPRVRQSAAEHVEDSATRPNPADMDEHQRVIRRLEAHIEELREALTESQARIRESSEISRQNEMLRQALAQANEQRSADANVLSREAQVRAELETLREELDNVRTRHKDTIEALDAAIQRGHEARAKAAAAMTLVLDHDSEVARLRHSITERDRQIDDLRRRLLEAEQARAADAAAFLDSLREQ